MTKLLPPPESSLDNLLSDVRSIESNKLSINKADWSNHFYLIKGSYIEIKCRWSGKTKLLTYIESVDMLNEEFILALGSDSIERGDLIFLVDYKVH